jgi:polyhydroxyalkanoate synthase
MRDLLTYPRTVAGVLGDALGAITGTGKAAARPALMPTPRDEVASFGGARLYRFRIPAGVAPATGAPVLLVPSLINKWYVLDLRSGASLVEAMVDAGIDTYCLDWGAPEAEDRYLDWEMVLDRLRRAARLVRRTSGHDRIGLLGYCMGGTLAAIHAARHPDEIAALIDLAGPIDFAKAGRLREMVDPRWFDADAVADAGNVTADQMQAGFTALRPTLALSKLVSAPDLAGDAAAKLAFDALEAWASDTIDFPGEAYRTYIADLYQRNALVAGTHVVAGRPVRLADIRCPTLVIVAERDEICPPEAARALLDHVATTDTTVHAVPGGHVGAVVGSRAARSMYPTAIAWLRDRL